MTDDELKAKAIAVVKKWLPLLGLQNWNISYDVQDGGDDFMIQLTWPHDYQRITMELSRNPPRPDIDWADDNFEHHLVHELCHLLIAPIRNFIDREFTANGIFWPTWRMANEASVDAITQVVLRLASP